LKVKIESDGFRVLFDRLIIAAHLVSPVLRRSLYIQDLDFRWARLWRAASSDTEATEGCLMGKCSPIAAKILSMWERTQAGRPPNCGRGGFCKF
jgi:hypothetical protein